MMRTGGLEGLFMSLTGMMTYRSEWGVQGVCLPTVSLLCIGEGAWNEKMTGYPSAGCVGIMV